ncbi:MAG: winged helix-turn-helix transcriptional regulator [Nanoarchaeota archaeon]|nr:winged helix-turn-helix transcriptional regulator [Nanoarchaeota archaeon]
MKQAKQILVGKPLFENIFGEGSVIKVLDFLVMGKNFDFTLSHISNGTGLSRTAVRNSINDLIERGIVMVSREVGKSKYYAINKIDKKFNILERLYKLIEKEVIIA